MRLIYGLVQKSKKIKIFFSPYLTEEQTISKWELDQSTPDISYIGKLSEIFEVTTDYLIKGQQSKMGEAEENISTPANSVLTPKNLAGIIISILGIALIIVGMVKMSADGDWILGLIFGILMIVVAVELILSKKHPGLNVLWTIWTVVFLFVSMFAVNLQTGFGGLTVGGIVTIICAISLIILVIATVRNYRRNHKK